MFANWILSHTGHLYLTIETRVSCYLLMRTPLNQIADMLQALEVMPRPPAPTPKPADGATKRSASEMREDDDDALTDDEEEVAVSPLYCLSYVLLTLVQARMQALSQRLDSIRQRKRRRIVKRELSPIVIPSDNEVIELSD